LQQGKRTLSRLIASGPVNLVAVGGSTEERERLNSFAAPFSYYRHDADVPDMNQPSAARQTTSGERSDVLLVGNGADATSYVPESNSYLGREWAHQPSSLSGVDIIKLGSGKQGVAAISLPFAGVPPGSTILVTGGPMNGSTMLFAADQNGFYAYHAGPSSPDGHWLASSDGARGIADAHMKTGPDSKTPYAWRNDMSDVVTVARQYPFSALIYNGQYPADGSDTTPDTRINLPLSTGGQNAGSHMMTYSYFIPQKSLPTVGTAEAVIFKDKNGKVTVQVLGAMGVLDHRYDLDGGAVGYSYRERGSTAAMYAVPKPAWRKAG
jgi:hypothetical protein